MRLSFEVAAFTTQVNQLGGALQRHGFAASVDHAFDFANPSLREAIEIKESVRGLRDLHGSAMQLALRLAERPAIARATLFVIDSGLSAERIAAEWAGIIRLIEAHVAGRMELVVLGPHGKGWMSGREPFWSSLLNELRPMGQSSGRARAIKAGSTRRPTPKYLEVLKIVLGRWLMREGPASLATLARAAGCSLPTARIAIDRLRSTGAVHASETRTIELDRFPIKAWHELVALTPSVRETARFIDPARFASPADLAERIERQRPASVAWGGVGAARHWDPTFDLNGMPRIDLIVHAPHRLRDELTFVETIDAGLRRARPDEEEDAVLAVHVLRRADPRFDGSDVGGVAYADPVETALDLIDLGLSVQAGQVLRALRPEVRL